MKDLLSQKTRIKDIAKLANVSVGTVDRVLHKRGEVSEENKKKIEKILQDLDYQPNIYASALASKKKYTIISLLPETQEGEYWSYIKKGIDKAARELIDLSISVKQLYFDQYNDRSFNENLAATLKEKPDAVLVDPAFTESTKQFTEELNRQQIPYIFIDSDIKEAQALSYFGVHSYQSGYLAAKLLLSDSLSEPEIAVFQTYRKGKVNFNQNDLREQGFCAYLSEYFPKATVHYITIYANAPEENEKILNQFFTKNPTVAKAITLNSKVYLITDYIHTHKLKNIKLIGYDPIGRNVEAMKNGHLDYLITQRPETQGYKGIKTLGDFLIFKKKPERWNFMPIDILIPENIDFYFEFHSL